MTFDELAGYFSRLPDSILQDVPDIIAETAVEYYRQAFDVKGFDGNPWAPAKKPRSNGSLLVDSGTLVNSIEPTVITPEKVVISAGHTKAPYAKAHNEGLSGPIQVKAFTRADGKNVKSHTRNMNLPQRQFMGMSEELNARIKERIERRLRNIYTLNI